MIRLRACPEIFGSEEWTEAHFVGEDEGELAEILAARLNSLGWEVRLAYDAEEEFALGEEEEQEDES